MALPVTVGRGGAGNVGVAIDARNKLQNEKEEIERREAEMRREQIAGQVDGMLERPPGARIAVPMVSRRSSMLLQGRVRMGMRNKFDSIYDGPTDASVGDSMIGSFRLDKASPS